MKTFLLFLVLLSFISLTQGADDAPFIYDLNPYMYQSCGDDFVLHCNARIDGEIFGLVAVRIIKNSKWQKTIEEKINDSSLRYSYFRLTSEKPAEKQGLFSPPRIDPAAAETIDELNVIAERTNKKNRKRQITEIIDFREISQNEFLAITPKIIHVKEDK